MIRKILFGAGNKRTRGTSFGLSACFRRRLALALEMQSASKLVSAVCLDS